jgi:hypothetical protein
VLDFYFINLDGINSCKCARVALSQSLRTRGVVCPAVVCKLLWLLAVELTYVIVDSRVTEQSGEFHDRKNANDPCKNDDNGYNQVYSKEKKIRKKKCYVSGDVDDSCSAVNENVQGCDLLQNLYESDKYAKDKGKKRKRKQKSVDNRSHVSSETCVTEQSKCELVLEDSQHLVQEEEERDRKICRRKQNDEDKLDDGVSDSVMSVKRKSEHVITRPDIPARESQENGVVSNIEIGVNAQTAQDNECLITKDTGTKSRRKRTRRHKKSHKLEDDKMKREFPASVVNPKRETPIRSVAAPRTHIRFSDTNGDMNVDVVNNKVETHRVASQTECENTCASHVSGELNILEPLVTSTDVDADLNVRDVGQLKHLSSDQQTSTKWDVQALDNSQCGDVLCNGSSGNNHVFAKLLAFENFSTPRVYQRKKNLVTTDGAIQETLSNAGVETREEMKTVDKKTNFSEYPLLKEAPKEKDIIAFKVGLAYNSYSILFPLSVPF